jgi:biotin-(acetyl-CoA carboxylase) ligase
MKGISIMTSNAIVMAINIYSKVRAKCKWINDVILEDKKVAGVLIKN